MNYPELRSKLISSDDSASTFVGVHWTSLVDRVGKGRRGFPRVALAPNQALFAVALSEDHEASFRPRSF